jgi:ankyrin repeat protein
MRLAAYAGHINIIKYLNIKNYVGFNSVELGSYHTLGFHAANRGHFDISIYLCESTGVCNYDLPHIATKKGNVEVLEYLYVNLREVVDLECIESTAYRYNQHKVLDWAISRGLCNLNNATYVHTAITDNNFEMLNYLLERGYNYPDFSDMLAIRSKNSLTALSRLHHYGVPITSVCVMYVVDNNRMEIMEYLDSIYSSISEKSRDQYPFDLCYRAAENGNVDMFVFLKNHGYKCDIAMCRQIAIYNCHVDMIKHFADNYV